MVSIKKIVNECEINEKRIRRVENESKMLHLNYLMIKLHIKKNVSEYAYLLDYDEFYRNKESLTPEEEIKFLGGQIKIAELQKDDDVQIYMTLKEEYDRLKQECKEYYQAINIDLRKRLRDTHLPNIFVYQGMFKNDSRLKLSRHIIIPNACEVYEQTPNTVIYPEGIIKSNREARHFYNRVSFKYLEELSKDYTYDPKVKRLGKVRIEEGKIY